MDAVNEGDAPEATTVKELTVKPQQDIDRAGVQADPWGVRRAEMLIASLQGVRSSRVVVSPSGEIQEIHVLTVPGLTPKQVVRNVESALQAQLDIKVDHRKISVAQTSADVVRLETDFVAPPADDNGLGTRGVLFQKVEIAPVRPHKVSISVTLEYDGEEVTAVEDAGDTPAMRLQGAARAAVVALDGMVSEGTVDFVGAKIVDAFDRQFAFVGVNVLTGRDNWMHTGTCEVKRGAEQAAVLAVLDATNRWLLSSM